MKYLFSILLLIPFLSQAQEAKTAAPKASATSNIQIESNYVFDEGLAYNEDGEAINIKGAFTQIQVIDDKMYLTVFYNPSNLFLKKNIEEYLVASKFFLIDDGVIVALGSKVSKTTDSNGKEEVLAESCRFIFYTNESKLVIESLEDKRIKFILTGQQLPSADEIMKNQEEIKKNRR